mmetsp:Transcript_91352/g.257981  ORF Transcript_91352/g.257981 Transcript_91352/m.257981 type:complete len:452 (+) Transcript_91352:82-1437(+)
MAVLTHGVATVEPAQKFVGRLRRWHRSGGWGLIYSELHSCDVYLDCEGNGEEPFCEGDLVLFEMDHDENGTPFASNTSRADLAEVEQQHALLAHMYQEFSPNMQVTEFAKGSDPDLVVRSSTDNLGAPHEGTLPPLPASGTESSSSSRPPPMVAAQPYEQMRRPPPPPPLPAAMAHPMALPPSGHSPSFPPPQGMPPGVVQQTGGLPQQQQHQQQQYSPLYQVQQGFAPCYTNYGNCGDRNYGAVQSSASGTSTPSGHLTVAAGPPPGQQRPPADVNSCAPTGPPLHLEMPPCLDWLDPKAVVAALSSRGQSMPRRSHTFRSNANSPAAQLGVQWCELLKQACNYVLDREQDMRQQQQQQRQQQQQQHQQQQHQHDGARHHHQAPWGDQQWQWNNSAMNITHNGDIQGDGYNVVVPMGGHTRNSPHAPNTGMAPIHGGVEFGLYPSPAHAN